jgi:hypothetical protein
MLVLLALCPCDLVARPTSLPERQITGGQREGVGGKNSWRREDVVSQSQVGTAVREVLGVGRVMADGTDEDGAYAVRMDEWVGGRDRPEGRGVICTFLGLLLLFFIFTLL